MEIAAAKASGSGSGSKSKSGSGSGSGSGSKKSGSGGSSGSAKSGSGSGSGSGSKSGSSQPPSGGLSAPTSTKNKPKKKKNGEKTGALERLGNLQVPWGGDSQSDSKSSPKESWDHTPANSTEAREIIFKREAKQMQKQAKAAASSAIQAQLKKLVPSWLIGSADDPGAINCLFLKEYRSGTWICITLATFNTLSGITTLLIYLDYIFETANKGKQPITLNATQMSGALAVSLALGAAAGTSLVKDWKRRTIFCVSHLVIGCLLLAAGYFVHTHNGICAFICVWFT